MIMIKQQISEHLIKVSLDYKTGPLILELRQVDRYKNYSDYFSILLLTTYTTDRLQLLVIIYTNYLVV